MTEKMTAAQARQMMDDGFHCSQVVMYHAAKKLGMDENFALKATSGLGAGTNHGDTCGTISAGIIALSILYGYDRKGAVEENRLLIEKVKEFEARFMEKHNSLLCRELLNGYDAACPPAEAPKDTWKNCQYYCECACEILDSMMEEKGI